MDISDNSSSVSYDSQPPCDVVYPLNEAVEVPDTDGGLVKTVLVEGTGSRPVKGAKVTVHYVGTLEDGTTFDSSRDRDDYFCFTLGKQQVIKGWDKGVATMRVGEKALLRCSPDYAYGASGYPPKIPANATLLFEVELFDWTRKEDISAEKDRSLVKSLLAEGVDYETAGFESELTLHLSIFVGEYQPGADGNGGDAAAAGGEPQKPVWSRRFWKVEIDETTLPPLLDECLFSMRNKEVASFTIAADRVPDAVPAFDIPSAAGRGGAAVSYLVEILELKTVKTWEYAGQEKIKQGALRREKGNAAFTSGDLQLAQRFYRRALEFVEEDYGYDDADRPAAMEQRLLLWGNMSQLLLMKKDYTGATRYAAKILDVNENNCKALFRLAKALDGLQEWTEAQRHLNKILSIEPDNAEVKAYLARVKQSQKEFDAKQKVFFKRMFS